MSDEYLYRFSENQSNFIKNNSTSISYNGQTYFNVPGWFVEKLDNVFSILSEEELPKGVKDFIPVSYKDQQIKDLTELVEAANSLLGCVPISDHPFRNTYLTNFDECLEKYQSVNKLYQQKYLTK